MKNKLIIVILTLMPFLAIGQSNSKSIDDRYLPEVNFGILLMEKVSGDSERNIETTLIDDRKFYKTFLDFDLGKSYSLSQATKSSRTLEFSAHQNILLEEEPKLDFKWQFIKPGSN